MNHFKRKLLCVDDDADTCEMLSVAWGRSKYELTLAQTYAEALSRALEGDYDIILLDSHLPDGSGIELCKEIREADQQTPILFYSADAQSAHIEEALEAGATTYLKKPLAPDDVEQEIEKLLS
jgi:DNA-binding response OmpR family regulator